MCNVNSSSRIEFHWFVLILFKQLQKIWSWNILQQPWNLGPTLIKATMSTSARYDVPVTSNVNNKVCYSVKNKKTGKFTHKWSCLLNPFPHVEQTYRLSSLWVSLCFARALEEPNVFPHCSHFISGFAAPVVGFGLPFTLTWVCFLFSGSSPDGGAGLLLSLFTAGEFVDLLSSKLDAGETAGWTGLA